jgi:hypothetical protein
MEVKYRPDRPTPEARVAARLLNSGDVQNADYVVETGNSPNRVYTNIFNTPVRQYGDDVAGVDINGNPRGPADREGETP